MGSLHELPRFRDRWSYLYLDKCIIDKDASGLRLIDKEGVVPIPIDQLSVLMLGPGTSISHEAIKALADNNCLVAWVGERGVRLYAHSTGGTHSARRLILQAQFVSNEKSRMTVARRMYKFRFDEQLPDDLTMDQIRGKEGARVRKAYAEISSKYSVEWTGRNYDQDNWYSGDPINRALSAANACLYGVCHAAILSAGYSPALGFIHTGKMLSFVYDIADLYKTEVSIPLAFKITAENPEHLERAVRQASRDAFYEFKLMERIIPDISEVLGVSHDTGEGAEEPEREIVTLADRATPWSFSGESERKDS